MLATAEAANNALLACRATPVGGAERLLIGQFVCIEVRRRWRRRGRRLLDRLAGQDAEHGRGLHLRGELMESLEFVPRSRGTLVRMTKRLARLDGPKVTPVRLRLLKVRGWSRSAKRTSLLIMWAPRNRRSCSKNQKGSGRASRRHVTRLSNTWCCFCIYWFRRIAGSSPGNGRTDAGLSDQPGRIQKRHHCYRESFAPSPHQSPTHRRRQHEHQAACQQSRVGT